MMVCGACTRVTMYLLVGSVASCLGVLLWCGSRGPAWVTTLRLVTRRAFRRAIVGTTTAKPVTHDYDTDDEDVPFAHAKHL